MNLPSQDVLNDIKELITEITGFQEQDENFSICERYCLSHVVHHTYPFVNRTTVKNLINSFASRFYGHGYFRVSQELNHQVKKFLSNEKLFEINPQYDIQWSLLSLLSSLSSNLTSVKELPELLPVDSEEDKAEEINWKDFLTKDLITYPETLSSDSEDLYEDEEHESNDDLLNDQSENCGNNEKVERKTVEIIECKNEVNEEASESRRRNFLEFLSHRNSKMVIESDLELRGNISEKFDTLMSSEGISRRSQVLSEFEMMENVLYQFQTGDRIFLRRGLSTPALMSLTQDTLCSYLESLQPYFKMIRCFKEFDAEVSEAKFPERDKGLSSIRTHHSSLPSASRRRKIPRVLFIYATMLMKALEPFEKEVTEIVQNLENYTFIKMERKLEPYFFDLTWLFHVHTSATKNWKKDCNWMSSLRILMVLYNATMKATSSRMSFVYLNLFLHCFQVYLNIIDSWVSVGNLDDPNDEFIIAKKETNEEGSCIEFEIREYKQNFGGTDIKEVAVLDCIAERMVHVGQSLEILKRLNRFVTSDSSSESSYDALLRSIKSKISSIGKVLPRPVEPKPKEKKRSIFTMRNSEFGLERDNGIGDFVRIEDLLKEEKKAEEKQTKGSNTIVEKKSQESCREFIYSTVRNPFFKMAFDSVGIEQVEKKLQTMRDRGDEDEEFMVIRKNEGGNYAVYPFNKIISEAFYPIFTNRIFGACDLVKDIILKDCGLPTHLSLLRSVLLFNDAYLIQPFILALFTQPVIWGNSYSLTLHLKECMKGLYKDHADKLTATAARELTSKLENILQVIDVITISYEVDWPLSLIFTPQVMQKYNEIFRLALKLKWAHWSLSGLHFQAESKGMSRSTCHRAQLLRFWFLSALTRINSYFMTQMLRSDLDLTSCKDFNDIVNVHTDFIDRLHDACLLGDRFSKGKCLIFDILIPLCFDLRTEVEEATDAKLSSIENVFGNCQLQLARLMSSLEKE